jgi:hypothetical protein
LVVVIYLSLDGLVRSKRGETRRRETLRVALEKLAFYEHIDIGYILLSLLRTLRMPARRTIRFH